MYMQFEDWYNSEFVSDKFHQKENARNAWNAAIEAAKKMRPEKLDLLIDDGDNGHLEIKKRN